MTSNAERKRRKRAARKIPRLDSCDTAVVRASFPEIQPLLSLNPDVGPTGQRAWGGRTEKQDAAWRWFYALRREQEGLPSTAAARKELEPIRSQLTADEYDILCELCRPSIQTAYRVGRSRQSVLELEMSGLRKLVIYLAKRALDGARGEVAS
jgi:hypothetical protein